MEKGLILGEKALIITMYMLVNLRMVILMVKEPILGEVGLIKEINI